jgi:hypothetical protein
VVEEITNSFLVSLQLRKSSKSTDLENWFPVRDKELTFRTKVPLSIKVISSLPERVTDFELIVPRVSP